MVLVVPVMQISAVQAAARSLVDRPGITGPEPVKLRRRPHHLAALLLRSESSRARMTPVLRVDRGDGADIGVADARRL